MPQVPRAVHELLARRACLSEVQVLGDLADESLERIIRCAHEEARAKGRGELSHVAEFLHLGQTRSPGQELVNGSRYIRQRRALAS